MDFKDAPSWKTVKMKDIAINNNGIVDGPFGSNLKTTDYINDSINGIPVLTTKNLNGDFSDKSVRYISKDKFDTLKRSAVFPGDILVAKIGSIGKCCIYPPDQRIALIPANLLKITLREEYYTKYVYYFIQSPDFQALIRSITKATAQPAFNVTRFRELPISVPCYTEQLKTVQKIEESLSQLDSAVETLKKTKQQLEVYRLAVLKEAFDSFDEYTTIRKSTSIVTSGSRGWAKYYSTTGAAFIRIGNLNHEDVSISFEDLKFVDIPDNAEGIRSRLEPLDILISITADLGSIGLVPQDINEAYINQHIAMVRLKNKKQSEFIAWYLRSDLGQKELLKNKRGAGKLGLGLDDIRDSLIPVVSDETAEAVVAQIEEKLSVCKSIEQTVNQSLQQAEALRQSILKQAFEGE